MFVNKLPRWAKQVKTCYNKKPKKIFLFETFENYQAYIENALKDHTQVKIIANLENFNSKKYLDKTELIKRLGMKLGNIELEKNVPNSENLNKLNVMIKEQFKNHDFEDVFRMKTLKRILHSMEENGNELTANSIEAINALKTTIKEQYQTQHVEEYLFKIKNLKNALQNIEINSNEWKLKATEIRDKLNDTINEQWDHFHFENYTDKMENFQNKLQTVLQHTDITNHNEMSSMITERLLGLKEAAGEHWDNFDADKYLEKLEILRNTINNALQNLPLQENGEIQYKTAETIKHVIQNLITTGEVNSNEILAICLSLCPTELTQEVCLDIFLLYCLNVDPAIVGLRLVRFLLKNGTYGISNTSAE